MLWSPNEVLAYLRDDLGLQNSGNDKKENRLISKTSVFGGFPTWPSNVEDFVFIAENSEIYGPNPLFTIPCQHKEIDLNLLSTQILSADYQALSSKKTVSLKHAQLLMPDISKNTHAAVNYFLLFDSEARGFIRPTCLAYITSDKHKLICLADSILKTLGEASSILQHCNMLHNIENLKTMLQKINGPSDDSAVNGNPAKNKIAEDATKDIQDIISVIEAYEGNDLIDKKLSEIGEFFKKTSVSPEINKLFNIPSTCIQQPSQWKNKNQHSLQKSMKSLYVICGNGLFLGLYHLYVMHKHFRRKFENVSLSKRFSQSKMSDERLHFGACVKTSDMNNSSFTAKECIISTNISSKVPSLDSEQYFISLDSSFEKILLNFLNWERNLLQISEQNSSLQQSNDLSDSSTDPESSCSSSSGYISSECEMSDCGKESMCGHIATLENIWDVLEQLQNQNPGVESEFLEILKLFDDTKRLLFSILTRIPVVIVSTPEEFSIAQNFIKALSVFIPRGKDEILFVDTDRQEPLEADHFKYIVAANVCVQSHKTIEEIIPLHLWHSLCILNLRDCSLTAPAYSGVLLSNIDERFRMLPLEGPAFPIMVGIFCEVQSAVEWWLMVTSPSVSNSSASSSSLSKGFSRLDVQILLKLSKLCRN